MRLLKGLARLFGRLVLLPFKIVRELTSLTFRAGYRAGSMPVKASVGALKLAKLRGVLLFFVGLALGLLLAPGPGRELREKLRRLASGSAAVSDDDLADRVSFELGHAPRTWHLPQPEVVVAAGWVSLDGSVPHETAREELVRVASAIPGVQGVDDRLVVSAGDDDGPSVGA